MPTVAQLVIEGLRRAGVARLFGVPGGAASLALIEAAGEQALPFVRCHLESAAAIMAGVTGELTGRPGAVVSSLGAGVTASATGLGHAYLARAPVIYVSERHPETVLAVTTHQTVDHARHLAPIVKESLTLSPESAAHWVAHAARRALAEPRGPVHLDLPADVALRPALPQSPASFATPGTAQPESGALDEAAAMIRQARRPLVIAGLECRAPDARWLRAFAEALPAPVLTTGKGKGAIPDPHPLALGAFTAGPLDEAVMRRADLIVAFGLDPVELSACAWPYAAPVLSLRRSASSDVATRAPGGGAIFSPAHEVVGDLSATLEELAPRLGRGETRADWDVAEVDRLRRTRAAALEIAVAGLAPHRLVQLARELSPAGAIATVDAGAHMRSTIAYWHAVEPGECLLSSGLGATAFALPAAIAAQLAHPDRRVVCFTSGRGLLGVAAELETVVRLGLPIAIVAFEDDVGAPVEVERAKEQDVARARREGPDLTTLARAFGLSAVAVDDEAGVERAFVTAQVAAGPTLIAARVDASAHRRTLEIVCGAPEAAPPSFADARDADV